MPFRLGVAPFAKHENKQWGLQNIIVFIDICIKKHADSHILLFGGGAAEIAELAKIHALFPKNTTVVAGKYSLIEEIELMQTLDVMLCMDSSNLHLAALAGVATVSVWGATHPSVGFAPYGSPQRNRIVQTAVAELPCRPCSVFGDKPCFRGDKMCMASIAPEQVWSAVEEIIFP